MLDSGASVQGVFSDYDNCIGVATTKDNKSYEGTIRSTSWPFCECVVSKDGVDTKLDLRK